jgi:hypothetical protein
MEVGTWRTIYGGRFRGPVNWVSFFADGEALFLQTDSYPTRQLVTVDLRTGLGTERMDTVTVDRVHLMYATSDRTVLMVDYDGKAYRTEALVQLELPDYHERARVAYATQERRAKSTETDRYFSADRKTVAYSFDDIVVCRRTEDLGILWTRRLDPSLEGAKRLAISADGSAVAVAVADTALPYQQYYTAIYNGRSGAELTRIPVCGAYGMGMSPDGNLLAVGARAPGTHGNLALLVHIYDVRSSLLVASLTHDDVPRARGQFLYSFFNIHGIEFTSDGKYLITSGGVRTKVWRLGEQQTSYPAGPGKKATRRL